MAFLDFLPALPVFRIRKYVSRFSNAGATIPERAKTLQSQGLENSSLFNKLVRNGVFIETSAGRYYLDVIRYHRYRLVQLNKVIIITAGLLLISVVSLFL